MFLSQIIHCIYAKFMQIFFKDNNVCWLLHTEIMQGSEIRNTVVTVTYGFGRVFLRIRKDTSKCWVRYMFRHWRILYRNKLPNKKKLNPICVPQSQL